MINPSHLPTTLLHEFTDTLNLIGIILEIAGFSIILPHIKRWLHNRLHKVAVQADKESKGASLGIDKDHEVVTKSLNYYWKKMENIGIPLVIAGLVFQGLSTWFHS